VAEAAQDEVCVHAPLDELNGNTLLKGIIGALGEVNSAHPAAPNLSDNLVRANTLTDYRIVIYQGRQGLDSAAFVDGLVKEVTGLIILRKQSFYLTPQIVVALARLGDIRRAFARREVKRRLKNPF
jgi:hypothetical protein